jgi:hypothetical protein
MESLKALFSSLQGWAKEQPNSIIEQQPTPTPEEVILDDILDGHAILYGLNFPENSFLKGGKFYAFAQTHDKAWFWLEIEQDFEMLMRHWYQNTQNKQDEHVLGLLKQQESGQAIDFMYDNTLMSQQIRVLRQNSKSNLDGNPELWEESKDFTAVVQIKSCRTMVPVRHGEAEFGWTCRVVALYREKEGLVIHDPKGEQVHFVGPEIENVPGFLIP